MPPKPAAKPTPKARAKPPKPSAAEPQPLRYSKLPCAVLFPETGGVVGGITFGREANTNDASYIVNRHLRLTKNGAASDVLNIEMRFLRGTFDIQLEELDPLLQTSLFGTANTDKPMGVFHITARDNAPPFVHFAGAPILGADDTVKNLVTGEATLDGTFTLADILRRTTLSVILKDTHKFPKARDNFKRELQTPANTQYPHGTVHTWDLRRYSAELAMPHAPFPAVFFHDTDNRAQTALTQSAAQDVAQLWTDVEAMQLIPVEAQYFRAVSQDDQDFDQVYFVILQIPYMEKFAPSLSRLIKSSDQSTGTKLAFSLKGFEWNAVILDNDTDVGFAHTGNMLLKVRRPPLGKRGCNVDIPVSTTFKASGPWQTAFVHFDAIEHVAQGRVEAVNAVYSFGGVEADDTGEPKPNRHPPTDYRLYESDDNDYDTAVGPSPRRLNAYMRDFLAGRGFPTILHASADKSLLPPRGALFEHINPSVLEAMLAEMLPDTRARFRAYVRDHMVHECIAITGPAGTGKTHQLALVALLMLARDPKRHIYMSAPTNVAVDNIADRVHSIGKRQASSTWHIPLVVRGYAFGVERKNFVRAIRQHDDDDPDWINSHWKLNLSLCEWLQKVTGAGGQSLSPFDKPGLYELQTRVLEDDVYNNLRLFLAGEIVTHSRKTIQDTVECLMMEILTLADFIATTPNHALHDPYSDFATSARAVVLDEAGAMCVPDALIVWGPTMRPCALGGDERQLPPAVMDRDNNRFYEQGGVSVLAHWQQTSLPTFVLNRQLRIAEGLFDLAQSVIYPDVQDFAYAGRALYANSALAQRLDEWAAGNYHFQRAPGKTLPVFFHCPGKIVKQGTSRMNEDQCKVALTLAAKVLTTRHVNAEDIVFITPYKANQRLLQEMLAEYPVLRDVQVSSADAFQGREAHVVILVLCVTKTSGPLFVSSPNRLCAALTRHTSALYVVGDIHTVNCTTVLAGTTVQHTTDDNGTSMTTCRRVFAEFLKYFQEHKRVIQVPASVAVVVKERIPQLIAEIQTAAPPVGVPSAVPAPQPAQPAQPVQPAQPAQPAAQSVQPAAPTSQPTPQEVEPASEGVAHATTLPVLTSVRLERGRTLETSGMTAKGQRARSI